MSYEVVTQFEEKLANFVGSPFAIAVDSCTNAIFLSCVYARIKKATIPAKTYISVPCAIIHAGGSVEFENLDWRGKYQIKPYPIYDCACQLIKGMYQPGTFQCISFSHNKIINIGKGGMIFTDDPNAAQWFKLARYEGREEIPLLDQQEFNVVGWNMYMTPEQAARGLILTNYLKDENVLEIVYPDLSLKFKPCKN